MNLKAWKRGLVEMRDEMYGDSDHPDCPECGARMNFYGHDDLGDFDYGKGFWRCRDCGFTVTESEL